MNDIQLDYEEVRQQMLDLIGVDLNKAITDCLYESGNIVREKARQNLMAVTTHYDKPARWTKASQMYTSDQSLIRGIRVSRPNLQDDSIMVHIMDSKSFPLRFFEKGTKERYQLTYRGKRLNPPRWLSKYKRMKLGFFSRALQQTEKQVFSKMEDRLSRYIISMSNK